MKVLRDRPPLLFSTLLGCLLGRDREVILGDLEEEFQRRAGLPGWTHSRASRWYCREILRSLRPALRHRWAGRRVRNHPVAALDWGEILMLDAFKLRPVETVRLLGQELRSSLRSLLSVPGFTLTCVLVLGLAVAANTAIFSLVQATLFLPLPYRSPDELVVIWEQRTSTGEERVQLSTPDFFEFREAAESLQDLAAIGVTIEANLEPASSEGEPLGSSVFEAEQVNITRVSPNLFDLLGVAPALGSDFDSTGAGGSDLNSQILLSHDIWQRMFAGDPSILGKPVQIDREQRIVMGVLPEGFQLFLSADYGGRLARDARARTDIWEPTVQDLGMAGATGHMRTLPYLRVVGRLAPGSRLDFARQEAEAFAAALRETHPEHAVLGTRLAIFGMQDEVLGDVQRISTALLVLVTALLLIACANVSGLLLTRARKRVQGLAVRATLGANRWQLMRLQLFESGALAFLAALVGVFGGFWIHRFLAFFSPPELPRLLESSLDSTTLAIMVALTALVTFSVGLAPALVAFRVDAQRALSARGLVVSQSRWYSKGNWILGCQMGLVVVLLSATALMIGSAREFGIREYGFDPERVISFKVALPNSAYPGRGRGIFLADAIERLEALPGVENAAAVWPLPFAGSGTQVEFAATRTELEGATGFAPANYRAVTGDYFDVLGVTALQGRVFTAGELAAGEPVAVLSRSVAERAFHGEEAVGREIWLDLSGVRRLSARVVGTVPDLRDASARGDLQPTVYLPFGAATRQRIPWLMVRSSASPDLLSGPIRQAISGIDPGIGISDLRTLGGYLSQEMAPLRFSALVISLFGLMAVVLAAAGVYASMAAMVSQRWREMGVRLALGASQKRLVLHVVTHAVGLSLVGALAGALIAPLVNRSLRGLLFGVDPLDPGVQGAVLAILAGIVVLASFLPARRAARVDPAVCLRAD